ncbi:DUF1249 domain-containing protein [Paraferrimonas haliotis]|uniref:DUF1249 domain-containing protein n=1 Tax=Paraferrimonas haliotis TaxID=2013866 RepID=A0AA37WWJ1_9GAMM|nr:DUF1249 domain-containing protein [Paraferrimonas haliotis]GLS82474.1 hypothetical protein GCM10007894_04510 [Paraferrimonas haliotis]
MTSSNFKYQPNVSGFLTLCSRNYLDLIRVLPVQWNVKESVDWPESGKGLRFELAEVSRYTETVLVTPLLPKRKYFTDFVMRVRVYHDAQLAEVLSCQQNSQFKAVYDYPNAAMHQRDEKLQQNIFLAELLRQPMHRTEQGAQGR